MDINGKKISVKFYLNQEVKGRRLSIGKGVLYPLYVRVTYDRKTTRFPVANNWFPPAFEDDLESIKELEGFKKAVEKVIAFEVERFDDEFKISGLGDRMKSYSSKLYFGLEGLLNEALEKAMEDKLTVADYRDWNKESLKTKTIKCVDALGNDLPNTLRLRILGFAVIASQPGTQLLIYSWLIGDERKGILERFMKSAKEDFVKKEKPFIAFERVKVFTIEQFQEVIEYIDDACLELIDRGYTEHLDVKSIEFKPE